MKRILALLLAVVLLSLGLVSCSIRRDDDWEDENWDNVVWPNIHRTGEVSQHIHIFEKATCQSPRTCSCGATEGKPSNKHNFVDGACADCKKLLVVEIARLATDPGLEKPLDGFFISREDDGSVRYVTVRADIVDKSLTQNKIYARVAIKVDQAGLTTGIYEWAIERNTYIPQINDYQRDYLYGTLNAGDFFDVSKLVVTKNEGFTEAEVTGYVNYIPTYVDRIVNNSLIPALENNPSGISVDSIGFVNYG